MDKVVKGYEELRRQAMDGRGTGGNVPGLAVFIRQGMCGWMRSAAQFLNAEPAAERREPDREAGAIPFAGEVVMVLAAMVLSCGSRRDCER